MSEYQLKVGCDVFTSVPATGEMRVGVSGLMVKFCIVLQTLITPPVVRERTSHLYAPSFSVYG